jgi:isopenicillin-N N-acyltransferase like protein
VAETGKIPFVSVGWAGMTGVVTGLSKEGIFVAVNGGRAGEPRADGVPLPFVLREVLERAHSLDEAIEVARGMPVMVSHILFLADAAGDTVIIERSPAKFVVRRGALFVTNHFLDPELAADPHNKEIEKISSTLARYQRLEELVGRIYGKDDLIAVLRDHMDAEGKPLPAGDRRAIDAGIATHSVIADCAQRTLYVAQGPHTHGKYVAFTPP